MISSETIHTYGHKINKCSIAQDRILHIFTLCKDENICVLVFLLVKIGKETLQINPNFTLILVHFVLNLAQKIMEKPGNPGTTDSLVTECFTFRIDQIFVLFFLFVSKAVHKSRGHQNIFISGVVYVIFLWELLGSMLDYRCVAQSNNDTRHSR